jgi:hypothetical protein
MALITSAASGNFNAGATWVGGVVPTIGDEARASTGHTITINANVTCDEISNAGTGTFILSSGVTLTANVTHKSTTLTVTLLTFSSASPASANIVGNITGGPTNDAVAVANTSSGLLTITTAGNVTANAARAYGVNNTNVGTVNITANTISGGPGSVAPYGVNNNSTGTIIVTGNVTAGSSATGSGIRNGAGGTLNITGSVLAVNAPGISNATTGAVTISGSITASNSHHGLECTNTTGANITLSGSLISAPNGLAATNCAKFLMNPTPSTAFVRFAKNGTTTYSDFYTADNNLGQAVPSDVRSGTVYASGLLTGTCAVPAAASVASGVPVGSGTGTAVLTAAAIRAELAVELARIDAAVSSAGNAPTAAQIRTELDSNSTKLANLDATISSRLAPSGTLATVTTLTNAPTVPTASAIATQVRSELSVELGRVDAAVSTRLASSAYSAAPTTAQIATAVEGSLLNEADGQAVLNAIVGAIGNTNLSEVSLVAAVRADLERVGGKIDSIPAAPTAAALATAVWATASKTITGGTVDTLTNSPSVPSAASIASATRTELATELARVDVATSTRLASSGYTAPSNSDITAIKAKTDLLNADRLANVATTAIVGNLIAQANS